MVPRRWQRLTPVVTRKAPAKKAAAAKTPAKKKTPARAPAKKATPRRPAKKTTARAPRESATPVTDAIREQLGGDTSWRALAAIRVAKKLDSSGDVAAARTLRALMGELEAGKPADQGDPVDAIRGGREQRRRTAARAVEPAKRPARRRAGGGRSRS